jgi:hypothetical protein
MDFALCGVRPNLRKIYRDGCFSGSAFAAGNGNIHN